MELFYSKDIDGGICTLDAEESAHCVRVLRHRVGDVISVIDGEGTLYNCILTDDSPKGARARVERVQEHWGSHPYHLTMAVCPTKHNERFEWFAEKATEVGIDRICPVIGEHSERKVYKTDRLRRILLSAAKQSLKAAIPQVEEPVSVEQFIRSCAEDKDGIRLIACCFEGQSPRVSINDAIREGRDRRIAVLIGPEGDFSREEVSLALQYGFVPIHLGPSRLRTETAALTAAEAVYLKFI